MGLAMKTKKKENKQNINATQVSHFSFRTLFCEALSALCIGGGSFRARFQTSGSTLDSGFLPAWLFAAGSRGAPCGEVTMGACGFPSTAADRSTKEQWHASPRGVERGSFVPTGGLHRSASVLTLQQPPRGGARRRRGTFLIGPPVRGVGDEGKGERVWNEVREECDVNLYGVRTTDTASPLFRSQVQHVRTNFHCCW